jgi:hypothetical protein
MSEDEYGKVLRFPVKRAVAGRVYCPPLNIHFPQLFRTVQTVTQADLDALGRTDAAPIERFIDYTLHEDAEYFGTVEREAVRCITEADQESIVVRHHRDMKEAVAYLNAVADLQGGAAINPICYTKEGLFTLAHRSTESAWPGPMVIYLATYPADNPVGSDEWYIGIAPDGATMQGEDLEL